MAKAVSSEFIRTKTSTDLYLPSKSPVVSGDFFPFFLVDGSLTDFEIIEFAAVILSENVVVAVLKQVSVPN